MGGVEMIHLVAVKIGSQKWAIISSDVRDVREKIYSTIKKKIEDKLAEKEAANWSVIYDKEPK